MLSVRRVSKRGTCTWSRKCIPGGEAAYAYQNLGPRYRHNPGHWLGGNHDRDGDVLNCHRGKHFRMPGKSTLSRRSNFKMVPRQHSAVSRQRHLANRARSQFGRLEVVQPRFQTSGLVTYLCINSATLSTREKTVSGTLWYLACTEGITAKHREHEVAVRRNRESYELFGKTLIALDGGFNWARYANGSPWCVSTVSTACASTATQFSTSSRLSDSAIRCAMHIARPET